MKNLLIAGGGTGGHIAPAIAVGERAQSIFNVSYACTPRPVDRRMYANVSGTVHEMNPPRIDKGNKLLLPFTLSRAFFRARSLLKRNGIHAVLGTGGYSSFFAITAAGTMGIPAAVLDSNAIPGKSNRIASRFCRMAFTGLPGGDNGLKCSVFHTGTPVSGRLRKISAGEAREALGIAPEKPVVLFLGGSQGAEGLNDLALHLPEDVTVLLQCGSRDLERVLGLSAGKGSLVIKPFVDNLSLWYSAAELAVARAGGQTIAELSAFRLPAVLVPFPFAAEDHQTANAAVAERAGAAILRQQKELSPGSLWELLNRLLSQTDRLAEMERAMGTVFPEDPVGRIVSLLTEMAS